jgi:ribonucleotide monophosphatase NagD (HAD superfamily)
MIGDDVRDDCGGAIAAGLKGYLVRTGKYRSGDETRHSEIALHGTFDTFADAVDYLLRKHSEA